MTAAGDESRHSEGQLAALCPQLTATSLNLPPDMRFPIWEQLGEALARAERSLLWYLADWWVWAREKRLPPEEIHTIAGRLGFAVHTLDTYASVARAFETSRRLEIISFTHHQEVAALSKEQADKLLAWCKPVAAGGKPRSTRELRAKRDELRREEVRRQVDKLHITKEDATRRFGASIAMQVERLPRDEGPSHRLYSAFGTPTPASAAPALDDSPVSGTTPDELRALQPEPEPPAEVNRVEIARSAIEKLSFDDALSLFGWWLTMHPEQLARVCKALDTVSHSDDDDDYDPIPLGWDDKMEERRNIAMVGKYLGKCSALQRGYLWDVVIPQYYPEHFEERL